MTAMMMERTSAKQSGRRPARTDYVYVVTYGASLLGTTRKLSTAKNLWRGSRYATTKIEWRKVASGLWVSGSAIIERIALSN